MRHIAFLCGAIAVSGCAGQSEFASRSADLPGIQTTIDCNPTPEMIYSKSGDLIEVKHPVLHPSCYGGVKAANALQIPTGAELKVEARQAQRARCFALKFQQ